MPRLGRFLFGRWLRVKTHRCEESGTALLWAGSYEDYCGCCHLREIRVDLPGETWRITDTLSGYRAGSILRWRLSPAVRWELDGSRCSSPLADISIQTDDSRVEIRLETGWESFYYLEKRELRVLEVMLPAPATTVTTTICPLLT